MFSLPKECVSGRSRRSTGAERDWVVYWYSFSNHHRMCSLPKEWVVYWYSFSNTSRLTALSAFTTATNSLVIKCRYMPYTYDTYMMMIVLFIVLSRSKRSYAVSTYTCMIYVRIWQTHVWYMCQHAYMIYTYMIYTYPRIVRRREIRPLNSEAGQRVSFVLCDSVSSEASKWASMASSDLRKWVLI